MFLCLVFTFVFLGVTALVPAEIYKWQDETGMIHYSNTPPSDRSRILELYPTEKVPLVEDTTGIVYYLNVPGRNTEVDIPEITVSPEVLNDIMKDASAAQVQSPAQAFPDMTALTVRLAEVEKALEREIESRLKREQEYNQAQMLVKDMDSQNKALRLALTQMGTDLKQLMDALLSSRKASKMVADLVENGNVFKTISGYQTQQIDAQKDQIDTLRVEMKQLKEQIAVSTVNAVSHQDDSLVADLLEKNTFMEAVIKHQANVLNVQNEQIKAIEIKLAQLQFPDQLIKRMTNNVEMEVFSEESPGAGIGVAPRKERRRTREIVGWYLKR